MAPPINNSSVGPIDLSQIVDFESINSTPALGAQANAATDEARLRGPEVGRNSVERMIETRDNIDWAREGFPARTGGNGVGMAVDVIANDIGMNSVDLTADKLAHNELSRHAQLAGLPEAKADEYAGNVVRDAKDIRSTNPDLSSREVAERAIARYGAAFGDPAIDAEQNNPGNVPSKHNDLEPHRPVFKPHVYGPPASTEFDKMIDGLIGPKPIEVEELPAPQPVDELNLPQVDLPYGHGPLNLDFFATPPSDSSLPTVDFGGGLVDLNTPAAQPSFADQMQGVASDAWSAVKDFASGTWQSLQQGASWLGDKIQQNAQFDRPSILEIRDREMGIKSISVKEVWDGIKNTFGFGDKPEDKPTQNKEEHEPGENNGANGGQVSGADAGVGHNDVPDSF